MKLENVLLSAHNECKLCDFGSSTTVAKVYENQREIAELEEQVQKYTTSIYRAPEQVDIYSRKFVGPPVDVWALGCILYFLMFRTHAFPTGASNQIIAANYHIEENSYSEYLVNLLSNIFIVDPLKRPTAKDLISAIDAIITHDYSHPLLATRHQPEVKAPLSKTNKDKEKVKKEKPKDSAASINLRSTSNFIFRKG